MLMVLMTIFMLAMPTLAQRDAPALTGVMALAARTPSDVVAFGALRVDDDFFAQTDALLTTLEMNTTTADFWDEMFGSDFADMRDLWLGDAIAFLVSDAGVFDSGDIEGLSLLMAVDDREAAADYLIDEVDVTEGTTVNGRTLYEFGQFSDNGFFVVDDDVLYFTQTAESAARWQNNEYLPLNESEDFITAISGFDQGTYDLLGYADAQALLIAAVEANTGNMGRLERQLAVALGTAAGHVAAAGVNNNGGDTLVVDLSWTPDDLTLLNDLGLDVAGLFKSEPVTLAFAERVAADAQFVILSRGLGDSVTGLLDVVEALGDMASEDPDLARALGLGGLSNGGGLLRGTLGLGFAALTGLNLENDVLAHLRGDFAMSFSIRVGNDRDPLPFVPDFAIVSEDPDGQNGRWQQAISELLNSAGYAVVPVRGGGVVDLSPVLDPYIRSVFPQAAGDARLGLLLGGDDQVVAFGLRPSFEAAMGQRGTQNLRSTGGFAAATDGHWVDGAQFIAYINGDALTGSPEREVRQVGEALVSLSASAAWDGAQLRGRLTVDLR
jgi:hypothetical protein